MGTRTCSIKCGTQYGATYWGTASYTAFPSDTPAITNITIKCTTRSSATNPVSGVYTLSKGNNATKSGTVVARNGSCKAIVNNSYTLSSYSLGYNGLKGYSQCALQGSFAGDQYSADTSCKNSVWTVTITYTDPAITWSNSTLSLSRSGTTITATKGGSASHNNGNSITYYLYEGSTQKATFSGNTATVSNVSTGTHTYKVVANGGTVSKDGASASIDVPAAAITWSDATLTLVQNGTDVTATMGGTATHNYGTAVTYYLYEDSTQIGAFSNNTLTFTPSVGAHTYKTVASGGGISADGASASITVVPPYKTLKLYSSSGWIECIVYRYDGNNFIEVEPYYYNGTSWSECSHT